MCYDKDKFPATVLTWACFLIAIISWTILNSLIVALLTFIVKSPHISSMEGIYQCGKGLFIRCFVINTEIYKSE